MLLKIRNIQLTEHNFEASFIKRSGPMWNIAEYGKSFRAIIQNQSCWHRIVIHFWSGSCIVFISFYKLENIISFYKLEKNHFVL